MAGENVLSGLGEKLDKLATLSAKASIALDAFAGTIDKVLSSLGKQMTQFVSLANPAVVMRFNMALQNAMSAIGRVFIPILEKFTGVVQQIGNAIESLDPASKKLIAGLAGGAGLLMAFTAVAKGASLLLTIFSGGWIGIIIKLTLVLVAVFSVMEEGKELTQAFQEVLKAVGTVIQVLAQIFAVVFVPVIKVVARVLIETITFIARAIRELANLLGMNLPNYDPNAKTAQAVRQSQMTDIRGIASRAYTQTFGGAAGGVQESILSENQHQTKLLEKISQKIGGSSQQGAYNYGQDVVSGIRVPKGGTAQEGSYNFGRSAVRGIREFNRDLLDSMRRIFGG